MSKANEINLVEAISLLKEMQETNRAWLKETKNENCEKLYLRDIEAIEIVLKALENSISKDKIKEKIEELEDKICGNDLYLGEKQSMQFDLLRAVKKELLEDK